MSGIAKRLLFEDLVKEIANATDIPPNEIRKVFLLFGEKVMSTKCMQTLEFPFGVFSTQLLAPHVVKRIDRTPIYSPIQYTLKFTPHPSMIFDVPDIGGLSAGSFDPAAMYRKALRRKEAPERTIEESTPFDPFEDAIDLEEFEDNPMYLLEDEDL